MKNCFVIVSIVLVLGEATASAQIRLRPVMNERSEAIIHNAGTTPSSFTGALYSPAAPNSATGEYAFRESAITPQAARPVLLIPRQTPARQGGVPGSDPRVTASDAAEKPFTAADKFRYAVETTLLEPTPYIYYALSTAYTQLRETSQPLKSNGDKFVDVLTRYAITFATGTTKGLLASGVYPILFKEDPRYKPSPNPAFGPRVLYATSRVFVTEGPSGRKRPNYSRLFGDLSASALANLWERNTLHHCRIGVGPTFRRFGLMLAFDALRFVVMKELGPTIKKKVFHR
ncbi:MAG: hypothetical protein HY650_16525 [Acidobacteria bacterium]|nr:hypothetical protein [Acidobacteriota bacterium]